MNAAGSRQFTGRHMLAIMIAFFGVIIAVNVSLAVFARESWTGLVVQNSYVASQQFNQKMADTRAQAALDWSSKLAIENGIVSYSLVDANGRRLTLKSVTAKFMRPVDDREDRSEALGLADNGDYVSHTPIADGAWLVEIEADAGLDKPYRETLRVLVANGARS